MEGLEYVTVSLRLVRLKADGVEEEVGPEHCIQLSLGAVLTDGKTAAAEVEAIDKRCFERNRGFLDGWRAKFKQMFGEEEAHPHIPDSAGLNWHSLAGGGSGMQDACNQAQAMSRLIEDKVRDVYRAKVGEEAWGAMTPEEQDDATRFHRAFCHNHLRCTCIRHAMKFEDKYLKPILAASLANFKSDTRISDKIDNVFRAASKEFIYSASRLYAKGHGVQFLSWCMERCPSVVVFVLERADLGTRQDSSTEGAVALYMNRKVINFSFFDLGRSCH